MQDAQLSRNPCRGAARGRRRRTGRRRRRLRRALEPFALLGGLVVLSLGVVEFAEVKVPTRADGDRTRWLQAQRRSGGMDPWRDAFDGRAGPGAAARDAQADAVTQRWLRDLESLGVAVDRSGTAAPSEGLLEEGRYFLMSSSSTSKTSGAPPGMRGGAPRSP